jgi:hypothetical protein
MGALSISDPDSSPFGFTPEAVVVLAEEHVARSRAG